mmetsp:Transcript_26203/g.37564  ORF Transcript_26203/g.37564 Transcript_26203/m.37564 type:complete len:408 (+) Transcript_26203:434-1657(+)|eukprot:CAMPEP_0172424848 /NCGR_PEP_ID=MMETSP1064-20121228/28448_1 /TAXON_ID=202472 /ORGANISM="Aulacoseira subarctica , Strain CCAP 1002/5" /LENGTH=407 /DNA_ID=CAMNT_0013167259 /DNA_START=364 /DNA_END=1590 /DNA_ORIENTATION=-
MAPPGSVVNISGLTPIDDPAYRYKMPTVFGKIEGRGNGIKTVIPNITDVGLSLHRSPAEVNKFFGCELGAQSSYSTDTDRAVVNGAHTDAVLQQLMHKYIELFVLCPNCRLPETQYKIKSDCIWHKCAACGAKDMVDMQHKLCTFILAQDKKAKQEAKKSDKKDKKDRKENGKDEQDDGGKKNKKMEKDPEHKEKKKKDKKEKKEKKSKKQEGLNTNDVDGLVDDTEDLSLEDSPGLDDAGVMDAAVVATVKFLDHNSDASVKDIVEFVVNQQMASSLLSKDKIHIYVRSVLKPEDITPEFFKKKAINQYIPVIRAITNNSVIMERHLIGALESLCSNIDNTKAFALLIKELYEQDALEEDTIIEWAAEGRTEYTLDEIDEESRAALRAEAEPIVAWLQDDDDDSDC